jgi:hypothetical protein
LPSGSRPTMLGVRRSPRLFGIMAGPSDIKCAATEVVVPRSMR